MDKIDFDIVRRAGIAVTHFARICGISRVSAHLYLANKHQPRGLYRDRIEQRIRLIQRAMDAGRLPLPPMRREKRFEALIAALKG